MSRSGRRPWEIPIEYNEDRFPDGSQRSIQEPATGPYVRPDPDMVANRQPAPAPSKRSTTTADSGQRPSWRDGVANRSNDEAPLNYSRGPHDGELDVADRDDPHYD